MFDRDRFDLSFFDTRATAFIDLWLLYKLWGSGNAFYIPDRLFSCRRHEDCVSQNFDWRLYGVRGETFCLRNFLSDSRLASTWPVFESRLAHALTTLGNTLLSLGNRTKARRRLREGYKRQPSLRAAIGFVLSHMGLVGTVMSKIARWVRRRITSDPPVYPEKTRSHSGEGSLGLSKSLLQPLEHPTEAAAESSPRKKNLR